ncbi:MAG: xanthine dehydrogenase family protein molybdopterin-binding subunit, partial [Acidimicrobiia bacterium]
MAQGPYVVPRIRYDGVSVVTPTTPVGAYRGAGRPEAAALLERILDIAADELGLDPAEIRRRNLLPADGFPHRSVMGPTYDSGDYDAALTEALRLAGYEELRAEQAERRRRGDRMLLGIGLAAYVEITAGRSSQEWGSVGVHVDGTVTVKVGTSAHGQGHATTFSTVVADRLRVPLEAVRFVQSDTALVPSGGGTGGSRSTQLGGNAVAEAAEAVVAAGRALAAKLLEASEGDIVLSEDGRLGVAGVPARALSRADLAVAGEKQGTPLLAEQDFVQAGATFPSGVHVAVVEVDSETGLVRPVRHVAVDDCGRVLNPLLVAGQQHGGIAQGLGQALWEAVAYDEDGNPLTATLADYGLASAAELPSFEASSTETPTPLNPLGAKGIGESGTTGSMPAVQNAVIDALSHLGVRHLDTPLAPERVWRRSGPPLIPRGFCHLGASRRRCSRPCPGPAERALRRARKPISETSLQVAAPKPGIMAEPRSQRQERHEICRNCDRPSTAAWYRGESRSECSSKSPAPPRNNGAPSELRCGVGLAASTPRTVRGVTPWWDGLN